MKIHLPITDKNIIQNFIPQRFPMVMVDALWEYSPASVVAGLTISEQNIFIQDASLCESGIIEHLAQCIALHKGYTYYLNDMPAPTGYIGSIKNIEINQLPKIGTHLRTKVEVIQEFMDVTLVMITCTSNQEVIATGEMKTVLAK